MSNADARASKAEALIASLRCSALERIRPATQDIATHCGALERLAVALVGVPIRGECDDLRCDALQCPPCIGTRANALRALQRIAARSSALPRSSLFPDGEQRDLQTYLHWERGLGQVTQLDEALKLESLKLSLLADAVHKLCEHSQNDGLAPEICESVALSRAAGTTRRLRLLAPFYAAFPAETSDPAHFLNLIARCHREGHGRHGTYSVHLSPGFDAWDVWGACRNVNTLRILGFILSHHVRDFISELFESSVEHAHEDHDLQAFVVALCFLFHITKTSPKSELAAKFRELLVDFHNRLAASPELLKYLPSFRTLSAELLHKMGALKFSRGQVSVDADHAYMTFANYTAVAQDIFQESAAYTLSESRHLFVTITDYALSRCTAYNPHNHELEELQLLLSCMDEAVSTSLTAQIRNCGFYGDLPWMASLANSSNKALFAFMPVMLLDNLERCVTEKLVTGAGVHDNLVRIRKRYLAAARRQAADTSTSSTPSVVTPSTPTSSSRPSTTAPSPSPVACDTTHAESPEVWTIPLKGRASRRDRSRRTRTRERDVRETASQSGEEPLLEKSGAIADSSARQSIDTTG